MVQVSDPKIQDRRREILRAASEVFRERGFHAAGMREIASALGIAVGKLYYWFENKQALLAFCQEDCLRALLGMADRARALDVGSADRLWHLVAGHVLCLNAWNPGSLAHLEAESLDEAHRARIVHLRDRYEARLREAITQGRQDGAFRLDVDPKLAALCILGSTNWSVKWFRPGGRASLERIARAFAEQHVRGLLADPASWTAPPHVPIAGEDSHVD